MYSEGKGQLNVINRLLRHWKFTRDCKGRGKFVPVLN
jgi:hypothetical protein